jgi:hypothetical protein
MLKADVEFQAKVNFVQRSIIDEKMTGSAGMLQKNSYLSATNCIAPLHPFNATLAHLRVCLFVKEITLGTPCTVSTWLKI